MDERHLDCVPASDMAIAPAAMAMNTLPVRTSAAVLRLALPKGRMYDSTIALLADAGIRVVATARNYRPAVSYRCVEAKILKPQNVVEMLQAGTRDVGFAGADWVAELDADLVEVLDTELDPVRIVAAVPRGILENGRLPNRPIVVASEFERLTRQWIERSNLDATYRRSYGATEVFPPEDADCVIDVAASGATLCANDLAIVDELMRSSTRLYASRKAWQDGAKQRLIGDLVLLLKSVLDARGRVMIELNVTVDRLEAIVEVLPCMREPTIAPLHGDAGYAVKAAIPRECLPELIPQIRLRGGADIVISPVAQVLP